MPGGGVHELLTEPVRSALARCLATAAGADRVAIEAARRLAGGALHDHDELRLRLAGGPLAGRRRVVLRRRQAGALRSSLPIAAQFEVQRAAADAGVPTPRPLCLGRAGEPLERPFLVMPVVPGTAEPRRLTRRLATGVLLADLADALARVHRVLPATIGGLDALGAAPADPAGWALAELEAELAELDRPRPLLARALDRLARQAPRPVAPTLGHGDFRTGNFLVRAGRLTALLDWEFARWSDPHEDLGWFAAPCWRAGRPDRPAGGLGPWTPFAAAYRAASGRTVEPARLRWWRCFATARWAVIAARQGERYRRGCSDDPDLAASGRLVPALESELAAELGLRPAVAPIGSLLASQPQRRRAGR